LCRLDVARVGRPELDPLLGISFNVSRAGALTVVAVAQGRSVGVDIERQRPIDEALGIAESMFSEPEYELLRSVPPASRSHAFLTLWTRKESLVKAVGGGLSLGLDWFDVSEQDDRGVGRPRGPRGVLPFTIGRLDAPPGYVGAVTLGGERIGFSDMGLEAGDR